MESTMDERKQSPPKLPPVNSLPKAVLEHVHAVPPVQTDVAMGHAHGVPPVTTGPAIMPGSVAAMEAAAPATEWSMPELPTIPTETAEAAYSSSGASQKPKSKGAIMDTPQVKNIFEPKVHTGKGGHGHEGQNMWAAVLPALMNQSRHHGFGDGFGGFGFGGHGFGAGLVGGIIGGLLFGRRGFLGGDGDRDCGGGGNVGTLAALAALNNNNANNPCGTIAFESTVLNSLNRISESIPTTALSTQNVVQQVGAGLTAQTLQQTIALQGDIGSQTLQLQQGLSNVKDTIQNVNLGLFAALQNVNQNVLTQGCDTRAAVAADGDRTRALLIARFQQEDATTITNLNAKVVELQNEGRRRAEHDELRLQITNTNTAVAAQQQGQFQQQQQQQIESIRSLFPLLQGLVIDSQIARATNANVIVGNAGATTTGAQTANPNNVRL